MTRPLYWSVRRELWENRSIVLAPLGVASVVMFACFITAMTLPYRMRTIETLTAVKQRHSLNMPFNFAAGMIVITASIVAAFYCLEALYSERRDRSILFWKSLPVSDRYAVLAKLSIPAVVLPVIAYVLIFITHFMTYVLSTMMLAGNSRGLELLWSHVQSGQFLVAVLYSLIAIALWHAPIYAWFLFISAWTRRTPLLWAVLPFLTIGVFERIAFGTTFFFNFLGYRATGWFKASYVGPERVNTTLIDPIDAIEPLRFLSTPGLWLGLLFAATLTYAAIRLRRSREPI